MTKTLFQFWNELETISFDKKKAQGLVKRANNAGYDIYYAYHEDGESTWRSGWSQNDYKNEDSDVKIFEATTLIGKKKPARSFTRAQTYTAECAIFIFCPLATILQDEKLREMQIESVKRKAAKYAIADYENIMRKKSAFDIWQKLPEENKAEINKLNAEISEIFGQPGSRKIKGEKEKIIADLGGICYPLTDWQITAAKFENVESYIAYKQEIAVTNLLKESELIETD